MKKNRKLLLLLALFSAMGILLAGWFRKSALPPFPIERVPELAPEDAVIFGLISDFDFTKLDQVGRSSVSTSPHLDQLLGREFVDCFLKQRQDGLQRMNAEWFFFSVSDMVVKNDLHSFVSLSKIKKPGNWLIGVGHSGTASSVSREMGNLKRDFLVSFPNALSEIETLSGVLVEKLSAPNAKPWRKPVVIRERTMDFWREGGVPPLYLATCRNCLFLSNSREVLAGAISRCLSKGQTSGGLLTQKDFLPDWNSLPQVQMRVWVKLMEERF